MQAAICECFENRCLTGGGQYDIPEPGSSEEWPTCQECGETVCVISWAPADSPDPQA